MNGDTISFNPGLGTITLLSNLPPIIVNNLIITATDFPIIDGGNLYHPFVIGSNTTTPTGIPISGLTLQNCKAQGGSGGSGDDIFVGGGGGLGAGGTLFIKGTVTLDNIIMSGSSTAQGGQGGGSILAATVTTKGGGGSFSTAPTAGGNVTGLDGFGGNGGGDHPGTGGGPTQNPAVPGSVGDFTVYALTKNQSRGRASFEIFFRRNCGVFLSSKYIAEAGSRAFGQSISATIGKYF